MQSSKNRMIFGVIAADVSFTAQRELIIGIIDEAKKYIGAIVSASVHPCAHLLMNADIREEIKKLQSQLGTFQDAIEAKGKELIIVLIISSNDFLFTSFLK